MSEKAISLRTRLVIAALFAGLFAGCGEDPIYQDPPVPPGNPPPVGTSLDAGTSRSSYSLQWSCWSSREACALDAPTFPLQRASTIELTFTPGSEVFAGYLRFLEYDDSLIAGRLDFYDPPRDGCWVLRLWALQGTEAHGCIAPSGEFTAIVDWLHVPSGAVARWRAEGR